MRRHEDAEPAGATGAGRARIALGNGAQLLGAGGGEGLFTRPPREGFDLQGLGRERESHAEGIGEPDGLQEYPLALDQLGGPIGHLDEEVE